MMQKVSVILPVKNGENYLAQALASVASQATYLHELIVVDDASIDSSAQIVQEFSRASSLVVKYIQTVSAGPAAARNKGIEQSSGQLVTFIDHDDIWSVDRVSQHLQCFHDQDVDMVVGKTQFFSADSARLQSYQFASADQSMFHVNLGAATFRREVFNRLGLFDEQLQFSEDHDFFLRCREAKLKIYYLDRISLRYRLHENNMTKDRSMIEMSVFKVLHNSLKRRDFQELS